MAEDTPRASTPVLLADISNRLAVIESRLEIIQDHEARIRELEKARWQSAWITAVSTAVATAVLVSIVVNQIA